jgi:hypothetical protein
MLMRLSPVKRIIDTANVNFRLILASSCTDTGCNLLVLLEIPYDLDGNPRIVDGVVPFDGPKVDIGAYEYQP